MLQTTLDGSKTETAKRQAKSQRSVGGQERPFLVALVLMALFFGGIGYRLAHLQLVEGQRYKVRSHNNRVRIVPKLPVRGNIFDRHGKVLARSRLSHTLFIWPRAQLDPRWADTRQRLADILGIPESTIEDKVAAVGYDSPTLIRIARGLSPAQITAIEEYRSDMVGVEIDIEPARDYPNGAVAAHILGYTGEINPTELDQRREQGYRMGDIVGRLGAEEAFESLLRGEWGGQEIEVDGAGRIQRLLGEKRARAGTDITLTLDLELQKAAEAALGDRLGAIVALNPHNGEVLAMVSRPAFDPNIFSSPITEETWQQLQAKGNPFINRALRVFPPGSTFKIVTATAGMETGKYPPGTILPTFGYYSVGGATLPAWNRAGFGPLGYEGALQWSSNTFFGQVAVGVGGEAMIEWSRRYGFGAKTGIELVEDLPGLIADDAWKRRNFNDWGWTVGDTLNMSIGQGFVLASPLQVAMMFAVPANGGYRVTPHLLKEGDDEQWRTSLDLAPNTVATLQRGLRLVITSGTGTALNDGTIPPAAGKSGTAEAPPGESHAWFGAYAPADNPEIVVVAFAEHSGGGGGSVAAPLVREVMEAYFNR